ncbi:hypothetical protein D9619_011390 [Psilocybe cf. subviscida]|uniref:DUF7330 domain-containing protein n=1 Tax=Psilocybe cf. subviscida TaxID=2480587 RepID=A0A8H5BJJ0_9AGAR|nr:hypothetical protein D9619_011390 [Psilocybe cf. subviscida]
MILVDDKQVEALEARRLAEEQDHVNQDPPPTYASLQSPSPPAIVAKTINYVSISRQHNNVRETLIIDPALFVPYFLRPPLLPGETEDTRKNLRLESTHGHVYADITLLERVEEVGDVAKSNSNKRVQMRMKSTHGGITAKIHGPPNRSAFVLHAHAVNGDVRLHLPRTFHGPIIVTHRHGAVRFSDGLSKSLTTFGELDSTRRCFLGDFSRWSDAGHGWTGDELLLDVRHGNVKIHYDDDEVGTPVKTRGSSFLTRVFGL